MLQSSLSTVLLMLFMKSTEWRMETTVSGQTGTTCHMKKSAFVAYEEECICEPKNEWRKSAIQLLDNTA